MVTSHYKNKAAHMVTDPDGNIWCRVTAYDGKWAGALMVFGGLDEDGKWRLHHWCKEPPAPESFKHYKKVGYQDAKFVPATTVVGCFE